MNIPNILTLLRVALIPIFILLYYLPLHWSYLAAAGAGRGVQPGQVQDCCPDGRPDRVAGQPADLYRLGDPGLCTADDLGHTHPMVHVPVSEGRLALHEHAA